MSERAEAQRVYDAAFFTENRRVARQSARIIMPWVLNRYGPKSVVDVGCGAGEWGLVAQEQGIPTHGADGYAEDCAITDFFRADLRYGFPCRDYDLAICLEVAEHLPVESARPLVEGLTQAKWVLFSAAHPGQGGVDHQNEQWGTWWAGLFAEYGKYGSSTVKWAFWDDRRVQDFYRENMLVFGDEPLGAPVVDVIHPERLGTWPS